jgi:peptidyl-prolyl cis-trans isomerase B (cyclophilin B)
VASTKERQRKLARERAQRRLAALAQKQRQKRQTQAIIGATLALVLIGLGVAWGLGAFSSSPAPTPTAAAGSCTWTPRDAATDQNAVDVGLPPATNNPTSGTQTMAITTNLGEIDATVDLAKATCTGASFTYLAGKKFFDNTKCFKLSTPLKTIQCGDPKNDGSGGPAYTFADENKPTAPIADSPAFYSKGQIVMVNSGGNTNGSQFYIIAADGTTLSNAYSVVGTVTTGMDIVDQVFAAGAVGDNGQAADEGKLKTELTIQKLTMSEPGAAPSETPSTTPSASAS